MVRRSSFKCQLAAACVKEVETGWRRRHSGINITQAYLKGESTDLKQCHLRPPPGQRARDHREVEYVWRLLTPLYRQGDPGRIWNRTLNAFLVKQGFARSKIDLCLYIKYYSDGTSPDSTVYVDDIFATTDLGAEADKDFEELNKKFGIKIKENPDNFLGMNVFYLGPARIKINSKS